MNLFNSIKVLGINLLDIGNKIYSPYDAFTRPAMPKEQKKLSELECEFYQDLVTNFWGCNHQVLLHRIPLPQGSPLDMGDQAIWHGFNTGILALRSHVMANANSMDILDVVKGLKLHQTIHTEVKPRLIRGVDEYCKTWQDDASNDSATGHLFGIYLGWKFGPEPLRPLFAELALGLAEELREHHHALVRSDGTPTPYGALEQGWLTDPLRISLALAIYAVASKIASPSFQLSYDALYKKYAAIVSYPKVTFLWKDNPNDTHRAAAHLAILSDLTKQLRYRQGLDRIRDMVEKDGNIWVNALCAWGIGSSRQNDRPMALKVLSEFTLVDKQFNQGKANYPVTPYDIKAVKVDGTWRSKQPLPRHAVRSQDFFWQRNLHSIDVGSAGQPADSRLNGADYIGAYWLSRYTNILNIDD